MMTATQPQEILTPEEVAALLRVSLTWVYEKSRRRQKNPLPTVRIGRYLRFSRTAVLSWFEGKGNSTHKLVRKGQ
jgi:excisionase family DNA binding protein